MAERIDRHRSERPSSWTTVEEPLDLAAALRGVAPGDTVIVDCLTLWLTNMMGEGLAEDEIIATATVTATAAAERPGETIVVTNEVGLGLVPPNPLGRQFRDLAGRINRLWADHSDRTGFVVAGRILPLVEISNWKEPTNDA